MPAVRDLAEAILAAWRTNHRVTVFLVSHLSNAVWEAQVPGVLRKTIRKPTGDIVDSRGVEGGAAYC
jgi:hypothetical protein